MPGILKSLLFVVVGAYAVLCVVAFTLQRRLMYFPNTERVEPSHIGLPGVEEQILDTPDGERIVVWRGVSEKGGTTDAPVLLYFHGNAGHLHDRTDRIKAYLHHGLSVAIMAYRGYSGSSGRPSEASNVADALMVYDQLRAEGIPAGHIVVYGESLGTGVATQLATRREIAALILDAPFTSAVDVAAEIYPFLPVRVALRDRYESIRYVAEVKAPVLVMHGARDAVIPVVHGQRIHAAITAPKRLKIFPLAGHSDHYLHGSFAVAARFIDEVMDGTFRSD